MLAFIAPCVQTARAFSPGIYAANSRLSEGRWVKVAADTTGVYQITYDELRSWGFADPSAVYVYGGGPLTLMSDTFDPRTIDDITPTYTIHDDAAGKLFFYSTGPARATINQVSTSGVSIDRSPYTARAIHLLSDRPLTAAEAMAAPVEVGDTTYAAYDAHYAVEFVEQELQNPAAGGALLLGPDIPLDGYVPVTLTFNNMGGGHTPWTDAFLKVNYAGADKEASTKAPIKLMGMLDASEVSASFTAIPTVYDDAVSYRMGSTQMSWARPLDDGSYTIGVSYPTSTHPRFLALDNVWYIYPRRSVMSDGCASLDMHFPGLTRANTFSLVAPEGVRVLNVTDPTSVFEHKVKAVSRLTVAEGHNEIVVDAPEGTHLGSFDRSYSSSASSAFPTCRLVAFDPAAEQRSVTMLGPVGNQNLHAMETPEMLIITTSTLRGAAEELAAIHAETDGLECAVVVSEDVFNEFGYGNPDAMAYRRLAKMLYDRDSDVLRYILLYGPAHWDNRQLVTDSRDLLMSYQAKDPAISGNKTRNFAGDAFFGMLGDYNQNAGIHATAMTVPVGRIPAPNEGLARDVNRKLRGLLSVKRPARLYANAVILSDDGDANIHLSQAEQLISIMTSNQPAMTAVRAHNLIYPWDGSDAKMARGIVSSALKSGVGLFTYTGHGNPLGFTGEQLWSKTAVTANDYEYPPLAVLATCDPFAFDRNDQGIAETMLYKVNGGMSAVIGASRTVYSPYNHELAIQLVNAYSTAGNNATVGDIWRIGRNAAITRVGTDNDSRVNTMCYNLCGDPSVPVGATGRTITVETVNDNSVEDGNTLTLKAYQPVTISGTVSYTNGGRMDTSYNGTATITVYDSPRTVKTMPRKPASDAVLDVTLDHDVLAVKTVDVYSGQFETEIFLPCPVTENSNTNRLTVVADSPSGVRAAGALGDLDIVADPDVKANCAEPVIDEYYINAPGTPDGSVVTAGSPITIHAEGTTDGVGINFSTAIGMRPMLTIDGTTRVSGIDAPCFTFAHNRWIFTKDLSGVVLSEGPHSATLSVADNLGRRVSATLSFTVIADNPLTLTADSGTTVTVDSPLALGLSRPDGIETSDMRLIVEDRLGNAVYTVANPTFPVTLDLASRLATGSYRAFVSARSGHTHVSSPMIDFIVLAPQ